MQFWFYKWGFSTLLALTDNIALMYTDDCVQNIYLTKSNLINLNFI